VPRPNLFNIGTWAAFEQFAIEVFTEALTLVAKKAMLPEQEDPLNRKLLTCCRHALHALRRSGKGYPCGILYEANNQPVANDNLRATRLKKRPDFTVEMHDAQEEQPQSAFLFYTVECKRLGTAAGTWIFNQNYTTNGVSRFQNRTWGYGKGFPSGTMIGYIQSMAHNAILTEVNQHGRAAGMPAIVCTAAWVVHGVTRLDGQSITRVFQVSPFTLHHLWLDISHRKFVRVATGKKKKKHQGTTPPPPTTSPTPIPPTSPTTPAPPTAQP
jgi:hypothetical protein